jgi:hypothetical protein
MDADDWTLASLMSCNGALGLMSLFLCYYYHHKKETALRVNVFFLLIATHGIGTPRPHKKTKLIICYYLLL